jgi:hypothetical protein
MTRISDKEWKMKNVTKIIALTLFVTAAQTVAIAQQAERPGGVPLTSEAHHHLVFSNSEVRAFYVVIPPGDHTLIHRHDVDYVWVGLGEGKVVNKTVNKPEVHLASKDAALHFTRGPLAHAARNEGDGVYRNVTIELLHLQNNPRNLCEQVLEDKETNCVAATAGVLRESAGASLQPLFETDEIRFDLLTVDQGKEVTINGSKTPPLVIALEQTVAEATTGGNGKTTLSSHEFKDGSVTSPQPNETIKLRNTGTTRARFLVFEFKPGTS